MTHGQCDARPTVAFPVAGHRYRATGTELYCLVTEAHVCEQLAQGRYLTAKRPAVKLATSRVASERLNITPAGSLSLHTAVALAIRRTVIHGWLKMEGRKEELRYAQSQAKQIKNSFGNVKIGLLSPTPLFRAVNTEIFCSMACP